MELGVSVSVWASSIHLEEGRGGEGNEHGADGQPLQIILECENEKGDLEEMLI